MTDDPSQQHDWVWSLKMETRCENVGGRLIHPLNPTVSVQVPGQPTYLFASNILLTIAATIHGELNPSDCHLLPVIKRSDKFPYRNSLGE